MMLVIRYCFWLFCLVFWASGALVFDRKVLLNSFTKAVVNRSGYLEFKVNITHPSKAEMSFFVLHANLLGKAEKESAVQFEFINVPDQIQTFEIPLWIKGISFRETERMVCPFKSNEPDKLEMLPLNSAIPEPVLIRVSTGSLKNVSFEFKLVQILEGTFQMRPGTSRKFSSSPARPSAMEVAFPKSGADLKLEVLSPEDTICGLIVVQEAKCPFQDIPSMSYENTTRATILRSGTFTLKKPPDSYRAVVLFLTLPSDEACGSVVELRDVHAKKGFTFVLSVVEKSSYFWPIIYMMLYYGSIYVVTILYVFQRKTWEFMKKLKDARLEVTIESIQTESTYPLKAGVRAVLQARIFLMPRVVIYSQHLVPIAHYLCLLASTKPYLQVCCFVVSEVTSSAQVTEEAVSEPTVEALVNISSESGSVQEIENSGLITVASGNHQNNATCDQSPVDGQMSDLSNSHHSTKRLSATSSDISCILSRPHHEIEMAGRMTDESMDFLWFQVITSIFFLIPVVYLVLMQEMRLRSSHSWDICFYNFACAHSWGRFTAFNNVISNLGYLLLGLLFLFIVRHRHNRHQSKLANVPFLAHRVGVPNRFGIAYASGLSMCTASVLSSLYHICPNSFYFQFDTSVLFCMAGLALVKLYSARHDALPARNVYLILALIVSFISLDLMLQHTWLYWTVFILLELIIMPICSLQIYYKNHIYFSWKSLKKTFKSWKEMMVQEAHHGHMAPMSKYRLGILSALNLASIIISLVGAITGKFSISSWLTVLLISTLLFYFCYYVISKNRSNEKVAGISLVTMALAGVLWIGAFLFYFQKTKDWNISPAKSRDLNKSCILLNFFDSHDLWHMLSATAIFFSYVSLWTLDDDLNSQSRNQIPVF